jgi:hypothetical protein
MELKGIEYLRTQLNSKKTRVNTRYKYYDMKNQVQDFGISTPPKLQWLKATVGWCGKAVDSLADRLSFKEFRNDSFNLMEIFLNNNADVLFDSAILSALISSCCFIYISGDEEGYPRLQVIDGANATGVLDPITGFLKEGYAVLERNELGTPLVEAYFIPGKTEIHSIKDGNEAVEEFEISSRYPALVPIIYRPDAKRPFGRSRITRACMDYQDAASRTIKRSEISAEFYSFPQKYVTGLSEDAEEMDKWQATLSSMLTFTKDDDGDKPTVGQFSQQSMAPHLEQLKMFAALFGGETGLTLDDLGFATGNPASSDAIKAAHESLRSTARKAQSKFGSCFLNVGIVAASIRDNMTYARKAFYNTKAIWYPVFEPDGSALSAIGDGAIKVNQAVEGFFDDEALSDLTGIRGAEQ